MEEWEKRKRKKDRKRERDRDRIDKFPEKVRANYLVNKAVRNGELPRVADLTCEICGRKATLYHHEDYSRPLDVNPLCDSCHGLVHQRGWGWANWKREE